MSHVIDIRHVRKTYRVGGQEIHALHDVNLSIEQGEYVAIMGPSGSGKSTIMNVLGCLDLPDSGEFYLDGYPVLGAKPYELALIRNRKIGFVFQKFHLLSRSTSLANVELPMIYAGMPARERKRRAAEALTHVGLGDRLKNKPNELSGGQQQRVSIARALVNDPVILLADEPTGALDSRTTVEIMDIFQRLNDQGITIVLVTHDAEVAACAKRLIYFRDGRIEKDERITPRRMTAEEVNA